MGLWFPPLRLLSAFLWHVTEQHLIRYYTRLEEFVSVVVKIVPDLLSAEERAELLLGLRAKFILELCYDQPSVTLQTIQPHLERVSIIAESASTDESGNQIVEAGRTFVNLIKTLLQNPTYRNHFFQDIYQLHYGAKYDKALQLLVWEFLSRLEKFIPVPSFSEAASWLDKDSSALEDALQVIYDTNKIENLLLYLKHSTHMDPGPSSSAILANTILSTLSVCFTAQIVLSPCRQPDECLSTQYDTHCSANDRNADIREENRGDLDEEDKCEEDRDEVDRQGDVDDNNPQKDTSDQVKQKSEIHGHLSQHENSVSNKSGQEVPTSSGEGLGLSPSQDGLLEMGSQSVNTSGEIQYRRNSNRHQTVYKRNHPHTCSYCDKTFKSLSHLKDHIRVHAEERPYGCTVCQMRFVQHSHLEKHSQSHTGERPHVCSYCGKAFKKSSHLKDHICVHTGELPYGCSVCGKRFIQHSNLVVHERKHTSENLECRSDGEVSSSGNEARVSPTQDSRSLEEESQLVNDIAEEQHACTEHGKAFSKATLTTLQKIKTEEMKASQESGADTKLLCHQPNNRVANQAPQHACSECGRVFIYKRCLIKHQTNHPSQNPHLCSYCGKAFEKKGHLKDHIRIHTGEQPYACSVCGEKFSQRTKRIAHERLHTSEDPVSMSKEEVVRSSGNEARVPLPQANLFEEESQLVKTADDCAHQPNNIVGNNSERPYNCVVCGRRFAQRSHLVIHNRLHTGEKPYLCSYCGKAFRQRSGLQSHIRVHTGERPYSCSVCGKRFIQPSSLTAHKRQHTGERPYLCSVCGKCFPVKGALSVHMRIHTGELPHKCEFCGKGFRVSCHLAVHRRVHTREKPYNCSVCEKKFSSHVAIGRHMRTHTGEKPYECLQCGIRFSNKYNMRVHQRVHR